MVPEVVGSSPILHPICCLGQAVKSSAFHAEVTGSTPVGSTTLLYFPLSLSFLSGGAHLLIQVGTCLILHEKIFVL